MGCATTVQVLDTEHLDVSLGAAKTAKADTILQFAIGFLPIIESGKEYELPYEPCCHPTSKSVGKGWDRNIPSDVRLGSQQLLLMHGGHHQT